MFRVVAVAQRRDKCMVGVVVRGHSEPVVDRGFSEQRRKRCQIAFTGCIVEGPAALNNTGGEQLAAPVEDFAIQHKITATPCP